MPARSMASTNGSALPSMIGTSGPSISIIALSMPSPASAASTCSAVEQSGPAASPRTVWNSVAVTARKFARTSRSGSPPDAAAHKHDARIGLRGKNGQCCRQAGMHADPADRGLVAKRRLFSGFHAQLQCLSPNACAKTRASRRLPAPNSAKMPEKFRAPQSAGFPAKTGKSPLPANNLTRAGISANSRFLTNCYL